MKGKQAIMRYLETHRTFTAKDVASEYGISLSCITKNAIELEKKRVIIRLSKVWRTVTTDLRHRKSRMVRSAAAPTGYFRSVATVQR